MTYTLIDTIKSEYRRIQRLIDLASAIEAPTADTQGAANNRKAPAAGSQAAANSRKAPAADTQGVANNRKAPAAGSQAAANNRKAPAAGSQSAANNRKAPAAGSQAAVNSDHLPAHGSLVVETRGNATYCYECHYRNGARIRKSYLGTPESAAVRSLCAARYRRELLRRLTHNQKLLHSVCNRLLDCSNSAIYSSLPAAYGRVSSGDYIDDRYEDLKSWAEADHPKNEAPFPKAENYAVDGTRIRSKGECIIYNMLTERGIPFRYDCLLTVADEGGYNKTLSPDFMIQCYDGSFVIIEHLGWMSDKRYAVDYGEKCYWYLHGGFIPGRNFLVTSDDRQGGTDSETISEVISKVEHLFWGY